RTRSRWRSWTWSPARRLDCAALSPGRRRGGAKGFEPMELFKAPAWAVQPGGPAVGFGVGPSAGARPKTARRPRPAPGPRPQRGRECAHGWSPSGMTATDRPRVALLWRGDPDARLLAPAPTGRLAPIFEALAREGVAATPAVYCEEASAEVRAQLLGVDGVLVWVDPISAGRDRRQLDPLLRDVAAHGIWVSSHPDVILKMGVKEVLHR